MDIPTQLEPACVAPDTFALGAYFPIPGLGLLPMNAFLIRGAEPVLVDTGCGPLRDVFMERLAALIDLADLRWVWLTHTDPDHVGAVEAVLAAAPRARVVTNFLGVGKMDLHRPLPPDRVYLLNPGQRLDVGDRSLVALRPPVYDAPETTAAFDPRTRALFSADCFGCLVQAPAETAADLPDAALREGMLTWAGVDAPWLEHAEEAGFSASLAAVEHLAPEIILSAHLPPARGMAGTLLGHLAAARGRPPFVGPDQAAFEAMLASG